MSLGITKVEVDCLGMADVQDSVGFRGEPCDHLTPRLLQVFLQEGHCVRCDDIALCLVVLPYIIAVQRDYDLHVHISARKILLFNHID